MGSRHRQLHLNAFLRNIGQHEAAWRLPETDLGGVTDIDHYVELARIAERGKLDAVFFADHPVLKGKTEFRPFDALDPLTLVTALATVTERIGLVATASTTYNEPYGLARRYATLDHVSKGRAGWNVVTTANQGAAANFGHHAHPDPETRYERADEFLAVAFGLWDSWEHDAIVGDKAGGVFVDGEKIHRLDHEGEFFRVAGPLEVPRSPQGRPVIFQAGSSEPGRRLAGKYAEAIFTAQPTLPEGLEFYRDVKQRVRRSGRDPEAVKVLPGLAPIVAGTEAEARALEVQLERLTIPEYGLDQLGDLLGVDVGAVDLDAPLPARLRPATGSHIKSRFELVQRIVQREPEITLRRLLLRLSGGRGHRVVVGAPEQIADTIEEWFRAGAADGFNVIPPALPSSLRAFVDGVVPELQRRGLFRAEYEGTTLREHLGLPRPASRHAAARPEPVAV